nr:hypothetical protein [Tanacetum cinerariifolium]
MNKLVRNNLVKGFPFKCFENDHTCVACLKGKQHKASCKTKLVNSVSKPLHTLHMESSNNDAQDACNADAPESSGISNPTATSKIPPADQMETLTLKSVIPTVSLPVLTACLDTSPETSSVSRLISKGVISQEETPSLDNMLTLSNRFEDILGDTTNSVDTNGVEANLSNMETSITASPTPTFRIHKDHPKSQIIGPVDSPEEPKKIGDALKDPSWVEAMQKELLQFKIQNVWIFVDCPKGVRPIGTKWVLKNKKDKRGIMIRNKAMLVAQGHTQEKGIDYEEVFAPVARIKAIRLFLAYASFMGFTVYQMDVKSAFLYGTIDEEVYMMQPLRFQDPEFPDRVYKEEKEMYGLHQAPKAWKPRRKVTEVPQPSDPTSVADEVVNEEMDDSLERATTIATSLDAERDRGNIFKTQSKATPNEPGSQGTSSSGGPKEFEALMHEKFQMSAMGELNFFLDLQVLQKKDSIFLSQDKYASSDPKECHLHVVKRIFRYLKGHPKLGLWYPKESPFDLVAYSDSDYGGATQDRKSTTGGCQF